MSDENWKGHPILYLPASICRDARNSGMVPEGHLALNIYIVSNLTCFQFRGFSCFFASLVACVR